MAFRLTDPPPDSGDPDAVPTSDTSAQGGTITAHVGPQDSAPAALLDLSPEMVSVLWPGAVLPEPGEAVPIFLEADGQRSGPLLAEVESIDAVPGGPRVDLRLVTPPVEQAREILGYLANSPTPPGRTTTIARREDIDDPALIFDMLDSLATSGCSGTLRSRDQSPVEVSGLGCDARSGRVDFRVGGPVEATSTWLVEIEGFNSIFLFRAEDLRLEGLGQCSVLLPARLTRLRRRWSRRVRAPNLIVRFVHPRYPSLTVIRPVRDVSVEGLSFYADAHRDIVYPDLALPEVIVDATGEEPIHLGAEVRNVHRDPADGDICGVRLRPRSPDQDVRWRRLVAQRLYPRTRTGSQWNDAVWQVYTDSGYFNLSGRTPRDFTTLRPIVTEVYRRFDDCPHLGFRVVRPSARGIEGSACAVKIYTGTWMGHQMAKRPGASPDGASAKEVLRDMYLGAYEPLLGDAAFRWFIGFIEQHVRWMRAAHVEFALAHEATGQACSLPFQLMEGSINLMMRLGLGPADLTVAEATEAERAHFAAEIERTRPRAYREALDLVPERLALSELISSWRTAGMRRERQILVARRGSRTLAAALLERAERGINAFHLLDSLRLFALDADVEEREAAFTRLLREAASWHGRRGAKSFVYYRETEGPHSSVLTDLGAGWQWVIARELMPDWLEHIFRLTSPGRPPATATAAAAAK